MQTSRAASLAPVRSRVRRSAVRTRAAAAPVTWGNRSCHNGAHLSKERKAELEKVCEHIAQRGKGITACDEGEIAALVHRLALCTAAVLRARCRSAVVLTHICVSCAQGPAPSATDSPR